MMDVLIIFLVVVGIIWGMVYGLIYQLASLLGLVAGFFVARATFFKLSVLLFSYFPDISETICSVVAFILIWLLVWLLCQIIGKFLMQLFSAVGLGLLNRLLGGVVGALKMIVILSLIINVVDVLDTDHRLISVKTKEASRFYYPLKHMVGNYLPLIETNLNEQLDTNMYARRTQ